MWGECVDCCICILYYKVFLKFYGNWKKLNKDIKDVN